MPAASCLSAGRPLSWGPWYRGSAPELFEPWTVLLLVFQPRYSRAPFGSHSSSLGDPRTRGRSAAGPGWATGSLLPQLGARGMGAFVL